MNNLLTQAHSLNPKKVLKRGYCISFREKDHSVIMSGKSVDKNEPFIVQFHDEKLKVHPQTQEVYERS